MSNKTIDAEAFIAYVQDLGRYRRKSDAINAIKGVVFGLQKALFENDIVAVNHLGVFTKKQQESKEVVDKYTLLKTTKPGELAISFLMNKEIEEVVNMPRFPMRAYSSAPKRAPRTPKVHPEQDTHQTEFDFTSNTADEEQITTSPEDKVATNQKQTEDKVEETTSTETGKDDWKAEKAKMLAEAEVKRQQQRKKNAAYQRAYRLRQKIKRSKKAKPVKKVVKKRKPSLRKTLLGVIHDRSKHRTTSGV